MPLLMIFLRAVNKLATQVEIAYFRAGTEILNYGEDIADFLLFEQVL